MTREERELVLVDLCGRLKHGVTVRKESDWFYDEVKPYKTFLSINDLSALQDFVAGKNTIKPYLRTMNSMTEEEEIFYNTVFTTLKDYEKVDWLNAQLLDYRGLVPRGLALEAPKGMYDLKQQYYDKRRNKEKSLRHLP